MIIVLEISNRSVWFEDLIRFFIFFGLGEIFFFFNFVEDLYELLMVKGKGKEYSNLYKFLIGLRKKNVFFGSGGIEDRIKFSG